jgi:uncharacterized membrane protein
MSLAELRAGMEFVGFGFETLGVAVIALGTMLAIGRVLAQGIRNIRSPYRQLRQELGGAIVLGLEFLVAGDIIRTVAVDPSLQSVAVLSVIVVIRTFLSMTLQLEIDGCWPWQRRARSESDNGAPLRAQPSAPPKP